MRKRMQILALLLAVAMLSSLTVSVAASGTTLTYTGGDTVFHLTGCSDRAVAGQNVTLKVTVPNGTPTTEDDEIIYMRQALTEADGSYSFDFELTTYGDAQAVVSVEGVRESPVDLYKSSDAEVEAALAAADAGIYNTVLNATHSKVLMVNPAEFTADGLLTRVMDAQADGYYRAGGMSAFSDVYRTGLFLVAVKNAANAQAAIDALATYRDVIDISTKNAGTIFANYSDSAKATVLDAVKGKEYVGEANFVDAVYEAVIMKELAAAYGSNEKYGVLTDNNDFLGFDLAKYESLGSYFTAFKEQLFSSWFTDKATLLAAAERVYAAVLDDKASDSDRGSSGGGGGGGGFSVKAPEKTEKPETDKPEATAYFADLGDYAWAEDSINYLASVGVLAGKADKKFCPGDIVTRGEFIKILVGALGLNNSEATSAFADVPDTHWSYPFVSAGVKLGITNGTSQGMFGVEEKISRQDMAVMCYRALLSVGKDLSVVESVGFADETEISDYAKNAVNALAMLGVINGKGEGKFDPTASATRAEAAKIVYLLRGRG